MAESFLVDTSVLTRVADGAVRTALGAITGRVARTALTDLEIGYSARSVDEWDRARDALSAFERVDVESHHVRRATAVQRALAERGLRGRSVPDLIIAACAEDHGHTVLHYDADFDHIASITGQPTSWIVPAGSID